MKTATSVRTRIEASRKWEEEFSKCRSSLNLAQERDRISRKIYGPSFGEELLAPRVNSDLAVHGYALEHHLLSADECASLIRLFASDYTHRIENNLAISAELLDLLRNQNILERILSSLHAQTGLMHLVWHCVPVFKQSTTV